MATDKKLSQLTQATTRKSGDLTYITQDGTSKSIAAAAPMLDATQNFYVDKATGSDTNDGSSGSKFQTIAHAIAVAYGFDAGRYGVQINVTDGDYSSEGLLSIAMGGAGTLDGNAASIAIVGNAGTPANVIVAGIYVYSSPAVVIQGVKSSADITADNSYVFVRDTTMSSAGTLAATNNGHLQTYTGVTISGASHVDALYAGTGGVVDVLSAISNSTVTVSGSWAHAADGHITFAAQPTGSVTGKRYVAELNGVVNTSGGGASYIPGSIAGSTATGGQYA